MQRACRRGTQHRHRSSDRVRRRQLGRRRRADRRGRSALRGARIRWRTTRQATGWCSWQGLATLPEIADKHVALMMIGEHANLGLWPAGGWALQWWFDLPWSPECVRPQRPLDMIRSNFTGWADCVDELLATLTDEDLARRRSRIFGTRFRVRPRRCDVAR
ncbi:hypothetical protein I553_0647 [Mycobacterium xenopi 4042]|uniref:Uncharacterized protein n=1 Tax=Mycobacterium xenopi 4042 TaxID=1299334 RepID=X7YJK9_MYCXE|nr:hypothetical protein I553_0647 [Mycobacterium xenopi 4042]